MIYHGKEKVNHAGAKVQYPILEIPEKKYNSHDNKILRWIEGTLVEPVIGQIINTEEHGMVILSHGQYPLVKITDNVREND